MRIACPHCTFAREVEPEQIPAGTVTVSCPACGERFALPAAGGTFAFEPVRPTEPAPVYAGFWPRVAAALVDSLLVTVVQIVAALLFIVATGAVWAEAPADDLLLVGVTWFFASAVALGYYVVFTGHGGQTPGKMALRLKVVRVEGGELGYGKAFYREAVGKFVSGLLLGIGYLMVAFDARKQGLHDRMARTYVIKIS